MKKTILISALLLSACSAPPAEKAEVHTETPAPVTEPQSLPEKSLPESELAADSPLSAENIDDYLFLPGVRYVDLRSCEQIYSEGGIAGFVNIPFYDVIVSWQPQENVLFTMAKSASDKDTYLGGVGTFSPNYEESEDILHEMFEQDCPIVFISTAGVEAAYMINLLKQYGYDPSLLYNAGTFTNGIGSTAAYRDLENHRYYIAPVQAFRASLSFDWGELNSVQ
ncbi:MAG: hypothetical protein E7190_01480 [Erysipelotrichaceae bacterium]|nr:hypothetical protein [Erysipelotrichaceae bacterium]